MARSQGQRSASVSGWPVRIFSMLAAGWKESASAKVQCSRPASKAPTVVLPLPDGPAMIKITLAESTGTPSGARGWFRGHRVLRAFPDVSETGGEDPPSPGARWSPGGGRDYTAHGHLELHGQTRAVTFSRQAQRGADDITVAGQIDAPFAEWDISHPSFGSFVTTQNHGLLEFLLVLCRG